KLRTGADAGLQASAGVDQLHCRRHTSKNIPILRPFRRRVIPYGRPRGATGAPSAYLSPNQLETSIIIETLRCSDLSAQSGIGSCVTQSDEVGVPDVFLYHREHVGIG